MLIPLTLPNNQLIRLKNPKPKSLVARLPLPRRLDVRLQVQLIRALQTPLHDELRDTLASMIWARK